MMACLCAPTSHEGSFRCRFHRAPTAAQLLPHHRAAVASACGSGEAPDQAGRLLRAAEGGSPSSSFPATAAVLWLPPSPSPSRSCPRQVSAKRAGGSWSPGQCESPRLSDGRSAAAAIMTQHLQRKLHTRSSSIAARSAGTFEAVPSRLSRMSSASADDNLLLENGHHFLPNSASQCRSSPTLTSNASNRDQCQGSLLTSIDAIRLEWKVHIPVNKFKQSETCKRMLFNTTPRIVSTIH